MTAIDNPDPRRVAGLTGLLGQFNQAGVLDAADVHVAQTLGRLGNEPDERVLLAIALVVRALRAGSVCLPLSQARDLAARLERDEQSLPVDDLSWPDADAWLAAVAASPLVRADRASAGARPLRLHAGQLYLERDWDDQ
ncbi:MAG: exodeoxyribonuclease V subunit alpha, partial [Propionibacteriaceae bacterium]|nr:exodeoxyribonuclease V subunit alpha [Propionibacteriaceae bacterium]